jgi:hypothetical protein
MGVRKFDKKLRDELQEVLEKRKPEITRILSAYGVPQLPMKSAGAGSGR